MQNGHSDSGALLKQVRDEVRRRKLAVMPGRSHLKEPQLGVDAAPSLLPHRAEEPQAEVPAKTSNSGKPHLKRARSILDRALAKNQGARKWPRFLRGLRRNQEAINEAVGLAGRAVVETIEWFLGKFAALETRAGHQDDRLAELMRQLDEHGQHVREIEQRNGLLQEQQRQFLDLSYKLINYQTEVSARFDRFGAQQLSVERQVITFQNFVREQEKQTAIEQRGLAELQDFVNAQHRQNVENAGVLSDQQQQLADVRALLEQSSRQLDEVVQRISKSEHLSTEMELFVQAQQDQTIEEQRQLAQQQKQLEEVSAQLTDYQEEACARYHLTIEVLEKEKCRIGEIRRYLETMGPETFRNLGSSSETEQLRSRIDAIQASFSIIEGKLAGPESAQAVEAIGPELSRDLEKGEIDAFYVAFENEFRGDRDLIKDRLRFYLPIIERVKAATGTALAVDVGCGRGEWLELLQEQGYAATGVDLNRCMIEECRSRGLKVELADAISYLRHVPPESLSLVTGFHIVEHLPFNQLFHLFQESMRVLVPGGMAIFETPNPECHYVSKYSFYLDPTHRNPVPQELLCFAARQAGFRSARIERLQAYVEEGVFKGYLDYAGIFSK
jgi:SAM-dependent methyltransferase